MLLSVVIPMYNEAETAKVSAELLSRRLYDAGISFELIFSDDGSTDGGAGVISAMSQRIPEIKLICSPIRYGKGAAVRRGVLAASGDYVVYTGCNLAYGAESVTAILEKLRVTGADVAIGSRALHPCGYRGYSKTRKLASLAYMQVLKHAAGFSYTDSQCGLKAFTKRAAERIFALCETDGYAFEFEILTIADRLGLSVLEYPVRVAENVVHKSKVRMVPSAVGMVRDAVKIKHRHKKPKHMKGVSEK